MSEKDAWADPLVSHLWIIGATRNDKSGGGREVMRWVHPKPI